MGGPFIRRLFLAALFLTPVSPAAGEQGSTEPADTPTELPEQISFTRDIRPIFAANCVACHGGVKEASGISFIYRNKTVTTGESGAQIVSPGNPEESELINRVTESDPFMRMPPPEHGPALSPRDVELLRRWIAQGAPWDEHWAFTRLDRPAEPTVTNPEWIRRPMDRFVLAGLNSAGLQPASESSPAAWLRRAALDLTGLPPDISDLNEFLLDSRADAYERAADRLLNSPQFGERWAAMWLDLARYADTRGYERDATRTIWPYRDWLIRAFNDDLPYDQFVIAQMAGDMLPNATVEDRLASSFHRNSPSNDEGGTDDEEFRVAAIIDRVNTTWQVFQGLTFGCAQCHSHPYDPIEHDEYYKFLAILNSTSDADLNDELPHLAYPLNREDIEKATLLDTKQSKIRKSLHGEFLKVADEDAAWTPLTPSKLAATGTTKLRAATTDGMPEVLAEGTIPVGSTFTLEFPLNETSRFSALRIDALPVNETAARGVPEFGFMLSEITAKIRTPQKTGSATLTRVEFDMVFSDEAEPMFDPEDSLRSNPLGWASYTRMFRPTFAVFILREPVEVPEGSHLIVELRQDRAASETTAMVFRRSRFAVSTSDRWSQFAQSKEVVDQRRALEQIRDERQKIKSVNVPVMVEQAVGQKRSTFKFERGNWLDQEREVEPGLPAIFAVGTDAPVQTRLELAEWLVSDRNPLAARVMVNRIWQELWGIGLVETAEDFGSSGSTPANRDLLDDLAWRFQHEMNWSIKQLLKELVLSSTYRQDAEFSATTVELDPKNRLLARGPRGRLTAEMVRDQALFASGLLSLKMYGPPVMPPQPEGIWRSVYNNDQWTTSAGEDRYRRAVYTFWKRTSPYPSMVTFDAPNREVCTARRIVTNTPLQALALLNDPAYIECAKALGRRMQTEGGSSPAEQCAYGYQLLTGDAPKPSVVDRLVQLHDKALDEFTPGSESAAILGANPAEFALTSVANALLNLDVSLSK